MMDGVPSASSVESAHFLFRDTAHISNPSPMTTGVVLTFFAMSKTPYLNTCLIG